MYAPLEWLKNCPVNFKCIKKDFLNHGVRNIESLTPQELIDFIYSDNFCNLKSTHKYKDINKVFVEAVLYLYQNYAKEIANKELSINAELKDSFLMPVIIEEWSKYKQVYKPDSDFANALCKTDKLDISRYMLEHLPCKLFYIDTSDCEAFGDIEGIFTHVYYSPLKNNVFFGVFILTKTLDMFSFYIGGRFNEQNVISYDFHDMRFADFKKLSADDYSIQYIEPSDFSTNISRKDASLFALQMVAYLSIEEPQITESDLTKHTYKPTNRSSKIRNKWSEVKIDDVGIKYGKSFRKQIEIIKKEYDEENNEEDNNSEKTTKRKSPIPHFRCAHWHKYWVGEGRTLLRVKWVEPVFVGNSEPKNIIIHKVGGTK